MVRQPDIADYTVHERLSPAADSSSKSVPPGLSKSVYTAKEVAEILSISTASVYEKISCMRIGGSRRYSRAVISEILERGSIPESERPLPVYHQRRRPEKPAKVVSKAPPAPAPFMTVNEVAKTLRLSPYKVRQLLDAKKIHYFERQGGGRNIRRDAVEHYVKGGTPREFIERVLTEGMDAGHFRDDLGSFERIAEQWRAAWPEKETNK